jgi:hypothetical protein
VTEILPLIISGVSKLVGLIEVWSGASEEKKAEILAKAKTLVDGLDALFDADDAKDKAAMDAFQVQINDADRLPAEERAPNPNQAKDPTP